jgi:prevent-host-death family protein
MKRYTVAVARQHLAEVLDRAEGGEDVVIERRGVRFAVSPVRAKPTARRPAARIEIIDPAIEAGTWSWSWSPEGGAKLTSPRRRKAS